MKKLFLALSLIGSVASAQSISSGLPQAVEAKVLAAVMQKCNVSQFLSAQTETSARGDQNQTDILYRTSLEAKYNYDGHPHVGRVEVQSSVLDVYSENPVIQIESISSNSNGLCK